MNPAYSISQYLHSAWKSDSGLQAVRRLKQTPDGYLWLATRGGLLRFDGYRFSTFLAGSVPGLESSTAQDLLVDPDGSLWVATLGGGVSHYQMGRFHPYTIHDGLPSNDVMSLHRDTQGVLWVGTRDGKIARFRDGRFEEVSLGLPTSSISAFLEGGDYSLWIATFGNGVFRIRDGVPTAFSVQDGLPDARVAGLYRDRSGKIWTAGWKGVSSWNGTRFVPDSAINRSVSYAIECTEDRDGNFWVAASSGLFRVRQDTVTKLNRDSGLSADFTSDVFEDREGNLWIATRAGLDRLRDGPIRTFAARDGLRVSGPIVVGEHDEIFTVSADQMGEIAKDRSAAWRLALPAGSQPSTMLAQRDSGFLIGFDGGVVRWRPQGSERVPEFAGLDVRCMLQAQDGSIWIGTANRGLLRRKASHGSGTSLEAVVPDNSITTLAEDHAGAMWAGSDSGAGLYRIKGQQVQNFGQSEGLKSPYVYTVFVDDKGGLWIGSTGGLSWFQDGRLRTASSQEGLPSNQVFAIIDDSYGRLWFATFAGLASIEKQSLAEWADGRRDKLIPTVYRASEGQQIYSARTFPNAVRSGDGHLWFSFADGVSEVTPPNRRESRGDEFPVLIEEVTVDGIPHSYEGRLRIPPGTRSIEIGYTAIALTNSESVRFRYRLEGIDHGWINADSRRAAFYNNLKPGAYTFTVSASSGAGQWREAPALRLEQLPFFYQTTWFTLLILAAVASLIVVAHRLRVRQAVNQIRAGFQGRMDERLRIARDLHDTLLQSFQGVLMEFYSVTHLLPDRPEAVKKLETVIEKTRQAIIEGRNAVQGLRLSTAITNDLVQAIETFAGKLAADQTGEKRPEFRVHAEGKSRDLPPILRDEIYGIVCEALRNAYRHAHARRIEVEIRYDQRQFQLLVRDDGKGIDSKVVGGGGRTGHYGLQGMHERAKLAGGKLAVWSDLDSGTEIDLTISAAIAYGKSSAASQPMASGQGTG